MLVNAHLVLDQSGPAAMLELGEQFGTHKCLSMASDDTTVQPLKAHVCVWIHLALMEREKGQDFVSVRQREIEERRLSRRQTKGMRASH